MSATADAERAETAHENRMLRAKGIVRELADVNRFTYEGLAVSEIAARLNCKREKVRWYQRVLQLRESAPEAWLQKRKHLWSETPPGAV